ncbi:MAG: hypothetical protein ACYCWE_13820 [Eubacteriales bacterium]
MKKFFILLLFILTSFSLSVSAATKQDVVNAAKATAPNTYDYMYLIQLENIFSQIHLTEEKCDRLIEIIHKIGRTAGSKGKLELYEEDNRDFILKYFKEVCTICGLTYEYSLVGKDPDWTLDNIVSIVYDSEGKLIGRFDGNRKDIVKKTDEPEREIKTEDQTQKERVLDTDIIPTVIFCTGGMLAATVFAYKIMRKAGISQ